MKDIFTKSVQFDVTDGTPQSFTFKNLGSYQSIEVSVSWSGIDAFDGNVKLMESVDGTNFVDIPTLTRNIDVALDSVVFQHRDFGGREVMVLVDFGAATGGSLTATCYGKTR